MQIQKLKLKTLGLVLVATSLACFVGSCSYVIRTPAYKVPRQKQKAPGVYRGVFHVHSNYSHDSKATLDTILHTANRAGLDFVVITDHNFFRNGEASDHRTLLGLDAYGKMNVPEKPILLFASEISTAAGHVTALGIKEEPPDLGNPEQTVRWIKEQGGHAVIAHPASLKKPWKLPDIEPIFGIEVFTFSDIYYEYERKIIPLALKAIFLPPKQFLNSVIKNPDATLKLWDKQLQKRHVSAYGASDAHLRWLLGGFPIESLILYFESVTTYVFGAAELSQKEILSALISGKSFVAFESRGIAQDFLFEARADEKVYFAGDTIRSKGSAQFTIDLPEAGEISLIRNGIMETATGGKSLRYTSSQKGVYRVEAYKNGKIWIISNPIYIE